MSVKDVPPPAAHTETRPSLLGIGTAYLANQVHACHPQKTFPAANRQGEGH